MKKRSPAHASARDERSTSGGALYAIRYAFAEFLLVPTCIITGFLVLAGVTSAIDRGHVALLQPMRELLETYIFAHAQGTSDLLGIVAAALITVTTLTTTLLLIALQQSASALTHQVYDQFLRRGSNQFSFGFFIGLSLYALVTLATVGPINPVFGAAFTFLLTIVALYLLLVLFYTTIDQMRPVVIMGAIHDHILSARKGQTKLLHGTRRVSCCDAPVRSAVVASIHGFVSHIDVDAIAAAAAQARAETELVLNVCIGSFVAYGDVLGEVRAHSQDDAEAVTAAAERAIHREPQRDITIDPLEGIEELENIAWTSISSAQSDPDPGLIAIYSLRDVLARWCTAGNERPDGKSAPVVYADNVFSGLMGAFESLAVAASESMQHQTYAAILETFAVMFDRLAAPDQQRAEDLILRSLSSLGEHVLTAELDAALVRTVQALRNATRTTTASAVERAREQLGRSVGKLGSRATRTG